jgi:hypothetical protein
MFTQAKRLLITASALGLVAAGCDGGITDADTDVETGEIASALELENGGIDEADELPEFGLDDLVTEAGLPEEASTDDEMEEDPAVAEMLNKPDAVLFHTAAVWGQFPGNPELLTPKDWTGRLAVSRGAIILRGTIGFEPVTDGVLPRVHPRTVRFTSATGPHRDGLRMTIIDPDPTNAEPLIISYGTDEGEVLTIPLAAAVAEPQGVVVNEREDRFVFTAVPQPVDICQFGFMQGRWKQVAPGLGVVLGSIHGPMGGLWGYMKGIYGVRENGDKVLFAKAINLEGEARGILAGGYNEGIFAGRWLSKAGEFGVFGGLYSEGEEVDGKGGFLGRWAERSCNLRLGERDPANGADPSTGEDPNSADPNGN